MSPWCSSSLPPFQYLLWFFCIIKAVSAAPVICDDTAHLEQDSKLLPSNSAVGASTTLCVVPYCQDDLYSVTWYQRNMKDPVPSGSNNAIYTTMSNDLVITTFALYAVEVLKGIYTCEISNITTNEKLYSLYVGFYTNIIQDTSPIFVNTPILSIIQNYPLSAKINITTKDYPPTNIDWFKDDASINSNTTKLCGLKQYHVLKDARMAEYELVLSIEGQPQCTYGGGYEVTVNTNGGNDVMESLNITQVSCPSNISLVSLSITDITISWAPPSTPVSVDRYCAVSLGNQHCTLDNNTYELEIPVPQNVTKVTVHLLSIGSSNSIPSQPETIHVSLEYPVLSSIQLSPVNDSALSVTWISSNGTDPQLPSYLTPVDKVTINVTSNCSFLSQAFERNIIGKLATQGTVLVDLLHPSVEYCVSVGVFNPWGSSGQLTECIVTSMATTTVPSSAPMIASITNTQQYCSQIRISWFPIQCQFWNGLLSHYRLCFNELPLLLTTNNQSNDDCDVIHREYSSHGYSIVSQDLLKYYTQYRVRIARVNIGNLTGPFSNLTTYYNTTECFPEAPAEFRITSTTLKTIAVEWSQGFTMNGPLQEYIVRYNVPGHAPVKEHYIPSTSVNHSSYTITELYPNTRYTVTIAAVNRAGEGNISSVSAKTTAIDRVSDLTVLSLANSIRVQWTTLPSKEIDSYKLSYTNGSSTGGIMNVAAHAPPVTVTSHVLSIPNNTRYTVSVAGVVIVNGSVEIIGPWTNTSGCHGICDSQFTYIIYAIVGGGVLLGVVVFLITCCVCVRLCVRCRYKGRRYGHQPLMIEMQKGGRAPHLLSKPEDQYVTEGSDVVLQAPVSGQPFPLITWFYNDDIIADDDHFELDEDNDSQLLLQNVLLSHAGVYKFTATNTLGSVEGFLRIFVEPEKQKYVTEATDGSVRDDDPHVGNGHVTEWAESGMSACVIETESVPLNGLADYIDKMNRKHKREFKRQFGNLQCFENNLSSKFGNSAEHKRRNRFENILPFDNNRIVLQQIEERGDCNHTYINASYIDGFSRPRQFIATQGPLPQTLVDFWRLIWQENVTCIVLLLKDLMEGGMVRCQQYWPDNGGTAFYGPYKVTLSMKEQYDTHIKRTLLLAPVDSSNNNQSHRTIHHYQLTDWPDHGLPHSVTPLVSFINNLDDDGVWQEQGDTPTLVHCSAGIGRTGVLLSIIIGLQMGRDTGHVDVLGIVNTLRKQRMKMIQTEEQYAFIHYAVLEGLYCKGSSVDPINLRPHMRGMETPNNGLTMNSYEAEFKAVTVLSPNPDEVSRNKGIENPRLSRSKLFLPPDDHRVVLQKKGNDFIHASFLNGYKQDRGFIIAESPTLNTVQLFWEMIVEQKCVVIVMLCDCTELERDTCYPYWPPSVNSVTQIGDYKIKNIEERIDRNYTELQLQVTGKEEVKDTCSSSDQVSSYDIHQLQVLQWSPSGESSDHQSIVATISRIEVIQRQTGNRPILIHCSDTVSRSGVFCTLYKVIQQCKAEQVVDIYQILKSLRVQKPGLIPNVYLYKMVYELLARYLESEFEIYRNFSKSTENLATPS